MKNKLSLIKEHKSDAIAALNAYLDKIYYLTDTFLDENGNLLEGLTYDEKPVNFVKSLTKDTQEYEKVRKKLIEDNFDLTLYEINLVGLSFYYLNQSWQKQIKQLLAAVEESNKIVEVLLKPQSNDSET